MKSILVNSIPEETRMALVVDGRLQMLEAERADHLHLVGNFYKGKVQNVLPGMQAAFVDIGWEKNAFLYLGDDLPKEAQQSLGKTKVHVGQSLLVQIVKDAIGTKGPRATTHLSLPGRNLVLMPTAAYIGLSKRIEDAGERRRLHEVAERICPEGMGLIVRTVAADQPEEVLTAEAQYLSRLWSSIQAKAKVCSAPALLYRDAELMVRIVRDSFTKDIDELVLDDETLYQRVVELTEYISPGLVDRIRLFREKTPIFQSYHVEEEIQKLGAREIELPSGGFLVLDKTEALTVIDVNTGKYVGQANLADTVFRTNLEAAEEILRQLRLRDIGGIILVDFIDMEQVSRRQELLSYLREQVRTDRTKTNIVDITALGLVEITRKKTRENFESMFYSPCPSCQGRGTVESPETVSIRICRELRQLEAAGHAPDGYEIGVHEQVAEELRISRRLEAIEKKFGARIDIKSKAGMHPEQYSILRKKDV